MEVLGEITKKNEDLNYGFITVKGSDDIFFSPDTEYAGTSFSSLRVGEKVRIKIIETQRGLFAASLSAVSSKKMSPEPEASI